jgi:hypothetical protein
MLQPTDTQLYGTFCLHCGPVTVTEIKILICLTQNTTSTRGAPHRPLSKRRWPELRRVRPLLHTWGDEDTEDGAIQTKAFDIILGADIIYGATDIEYVYPRLLASMKRFSGPSTTVLVAYKPRHKSVCRIAGCIHVTPVRVHTNLFLCIPSN